MKTKLDWAVNNSIRLELESNKRANFAEKWRFHGSVSAQSNINFYLKPNQNDAASQVESQRRSSRDTHLTS